MSPAWTRVRALFEQSLDQPPSERAGWLERAADGDAELCAEVLALLTHASDSEGVLDPPEPVLPYTRVGPFRLVRPLGSGGMGRVWLATREGEFDQRVAVKLLHRELVDTSALARFERERRLLSRLEHPNIARLVDGGRTDDGLPYLALEYVAGVPLDTFVHDRELDVAATVELFLQVCDAVAAAHEQGIVHRDLKPSNVLVAPSGTPKLLDFGIARLSTADSAPTAVTGTGQRVLTPRYAAPEQITGETPSTATDVYGLGALLYELLAGRPPLGEHGTTLAEIESAILHELPSPPSRVAAGDRARAVRGDLDVIVMHALAKEPARRYRDAGVLAADLRRWRANRPILARPDSRAYRVRKYVARHRVLASATGLVLLSLGGGLAIALVQYGRAEERRLIAEDSLAEARRQERIASAVAAFLTDDVIAAADPELTQAGEISLVAALRRAADQIESRFDVEPEVEAAVRQALGAAFLGLARPEEAELQLRRAFELRESVLGIAAPETAESQRDLARALDDLARYPEAIALTEELHARLLAQHGAEHTERLKVASNLAHVYVSGGRPVEAEKLHRELLEIRLRLLGPLHEATLSTRSNLVGLLESEGRFEEALEHAEAAADGRTEVLGASSPATLRSRGNLAAIHYRLGRYAESADAFERVLQGQRQSLGPGHGQTLTTLSNLVVVTRSAGELDRAARFSAELWQALRDVGEGGGQRARAALRDFVDHSEGAGQLARAIERITGWLAGTEDEELRALLAEELEAARSRTEDPDGDE